MNFEEFERRMRQCMAENDGRLFLVADSRNVCAQAAGKLFGDTDSVLIVTGAAETAHSLAELYSEQGYDFTVIESAGQFSQMQEAEAAQFRLRHPFIVLCAEDASSGESLLVHRLCEDKSSRGMFAERKGGNAAFCIADYFAACGYGCVILDEIYALIDFANEEKDPDPAACDRLDFAGQVYYTDEAHSYRRLKGLAASAKQCILFSDTIMNGDVAMFYAVLHLLHDDIDGNALSNALKEAYAGSQSGYENACEDVFSNLDYCRGDWKGCIQCGQDAGREMPRSVDVLEAYLFGRFKYMSKEEICLRAVNAMRTIRPELSLRAVVNSFNDASASMIAQCVYKMFYSDPLRDELEKLGGDRTEFPGEDALVELIRIFSRYGVFWPNASKGCMHIVDIQCEASGYEQAMRSLLKNDEEGELGYSVCGLMDETLYKDLALCNLLKDAQLASPVLVIAEGIGPLMERLREPCDDYAVSSDLHDLSGDGKRIVFADLVTLKKTALPISPASCVIYDFPSEPERLLRLMYGFFGREDAQLYAFAHCGDLSNYLSNAWCELFRAHETVPIGFSRVMLNKKCFAYRDVLSDLDALYRSFGREVTKKGSGGIAAEEFLRRVVAYADGTLSVRETEAASSGFGYFSSVAASYDRIFRNSVSAGGRGEMSLAEGPICTLKKKRRKDRRKPPEKPLKTEGEPFIFFNACIRMLLRHCDFHERDCYGCEDRKMCACNHFTQFSSGIREFFAETQRFAQELLARHNEKKNAATIFEYHDADNERELWQAWERFLAQEQSHALDALARIDVARAGREGLFHVSFADVAEIRSVVASVYAKFLAQYMSRMMGVFETLTEIITRQWNCVVQAYRSSE